MAKNRTASLDTNVILRLLLNDVVEQALAVKALLDNKQKYQVADLALTEAAFVLERLYKMEREIVVKSLMAIVRHPQLICNKNLFENVLPLYLAEPALSINDCALLVYARLNQAIPLYTFDVTLIKKSDGDALNPRA